MKTKTVSLFMHPSDVSEERLSSFIIKNVEDIGFALSASVYKPPRVLNSRIVDSHEVKVTVIVEALPK